MYVREVEEMKWSARYDFPRLSHTRFKSRYDLFKECHTEIMNMTFTRVFGMTFLWNVIPTELMGHRQKRKPRYDIIE